MISAFIQKYLIYAMVVIIAVLGGTAAIYYVKCGLLENKVAALTEDVRKVTDANAESQTTINQLILERTNISKTCEARLQGYDATLTELARIDSLKGGNDNEQGRQDALGIGNTSGDGSGDVLLDSLNGVFPMQAGGQIGICETGSPGDAKGSDVLPGTVLSPREHLYCFCAERDVKNWLKNRVLDQGRTKQFETILEGLR